MKKISLFVVFLVFSVDLFAQLHPADVKQNLLDSSATCRICFDELTKDTDIAISECGHGFCRPCIKKWMARRSRSVKGCPICRVGLRSSTERGCVVTMLNGILTAFWDVVTTTQLVDARGFQEQSQISEERSPRVSEPEPPSFDYLCRQEPDYRELRPSEPILDYDGSSYVMHGF